MEKVSLPIEQDGREEGDHHDGGSDHGDPSACDECIEDDAWDGQGRCPFFDVNGEEEKF